MRRARLARLKYEVVIRAGTTLSAQHVADGPSAVFARCMELAQLRVSLVAVKYFDDSERIGAAGSDEHA